mmetsp:Transcript_25488/g.42978  ORF Transcript_25488/g.42978 Transcript_25488/m.42978 type:complete len:248 (+) Transcript_25488:1998-2741(+)
MPVAHSRELIQSLCQLRLSHIPQRVVTKRLGGARGQLQLIGHAQHSIDVLHEVKRAQHLRLDLVLATEDVRVILLKATHAREARQRTRELVAVQHAKVSNAQGQLAIGAQPVGEHEAVSGTVHGLHAPLLALHVEHEHAVLIVLGVSGRLPQLQVEDIGRDDLLVAAYPVLLLDEVHEAVVDPGTVRHPECRAGRQVVEEKQLLLGAQVAVVALLRLLLELQPLLQLTLVWEGDAVHALQRVVGHLP